MKLLIVAATPFEIDPLLKQLGIAGKTNSRFISCTYKNMEIDFLITGIGMTATAYYTGKVLNDSYEAAINMGICGSFNRNLGLGDVVNVYEDSFSELGAEDGDVFLSLEELKLEGVTKITNEKYGSLNQVIGLLPRVTGITVNATHGNESSIEKVFARFHPYTESMEGAAFMFACENENIPYVQLRAVSNYVERRNRESWNIPLAIENINKKVLEILDAFAEQAS
jgi:futalosine hydrolase